MNVIFSKNFNSLFFPLKNNTALFITITLVETENWVTLSLYSVKQSKSTHDEKCFAPTIQALANPLHFYNLASMCFTFVIFFNKFQDLKCGFRSIFTHLSKLRSFYILITLVVNLVVLHSVTIY